MSTTAKIVTAEPSSIAAQRAARGGVHECPTLRFEQPSAEDVPIERAVARLIESGDFSELDGLRSQARSIYGNGEDPNGQPKSWPKAEDIPARFRTAEDYEIDELVRRAGFDKRVRVPPSEAQKAARAFLSMTAGHAYFAASNSTEWIKIGSSTDLHRRMQSIHYCVGDRCRLLIALPGGSAMEAYIHGLFSAERMAGEWFAPTALLRDFIINIGGPDIHG